MLCAFIAVALHTLCLTISFTVLSLRHTVFLPQGCSRRREDLGIWRRAAISNMAEMEQALALYDRSVEMGLQKATPVPESLEQAASWARDSAVAAVEAGIMHQHMYWGVGDDTDAASEDELDGNGDSVLEFSRALARMLAEVPQFAGTAVRLLSSDAEIEAFLNVELVDDGVLSVLLMIAPRHHVLPVVRQLQEKARCLVILINSEELLGGVDASVGEGGALLSGSLIFAEYYRAISGSSYREDDDDDEGSVTSIDAPATCTFYMNRFDPSEEDMLTNIAMVMRAWPRPFSLWEDNPDESRSVDGFTLLDLNDKQPPSSEDISLMLKASRKAIVERNKAAAAVQKYRRVKDADKWFDGFNE